MSCCKTYDPCLDGKLNQIGSYAAVARTSAQSAQASASSAQANATLVQGLYEDFSKKYLGSFAVPPVPPIEEGALYYNTVSNGLFVWNGTVWASADFNEFTDFTAIGTTTARDLVTRFGEIQSVKDFGAIGDGIANDTAANDNALLSTEVISYPAGEYNVNNRLIKQSKGKLSITIPFLQQLQSSVAFLNQLTADEFGEFLPNYLRRTIQQRYVTGTEIPFQSGDDEDVADKGRNMTATAYVLRLLCRLAEIYPEQSGLFESIDDLAKTIVAFQYKDERTARYGGIMLALNNRDASTFGSSYAGLALCSAYRVTRNQAYLDAAFKIGEFLKVMHDPNPKYLTLYGATILENNPTNNAFKGFLDDISASDTITITNSTWNLMGCYFLKELNELIPDPAYVTIYTQARDWIATGLTGFYDFWAALNPNPLSPYASNNWFGTGLEVKDGQWHRRGESVIASGGLIVSGAAVAATPTTVELDAGASPVNGFYNGMAIRMTSGLASGKGSIITAYNGATRVATLQYEFPATVAPGDAYEIGLTAGTIGSDQMEYAIEALYETGYNLAAIKTAYEALNAMPNADTGAFGIAYDSRICWPGFFRINAGIYGGSSRAFGAHYDVQGVGPLLKFKYKEYPDHFKASMKLYQEIDLIGTLVDQNFQTIKGTDPSGLFQTATFGMGTVKGTVLMGLLEAMYG